MLVGSGEQCLCMAEEARQFLESPLQEHLTWRPMTSSPCRGLVRLGFTMNLGQLIFTSWHNSSNLLKSFPPNSLNLKLVFLVVLFNSC